MRSEPEDVSLVDLDHMLDGSVDLNTNGGSFGVVVGDDLVSASLRADQTIDLFSTTRVPVVKARSHMSSTLDAVHLHAVIRGLVVVDDDKDPSVSGPKALEVGEQRVGNFFVGGDRGVLGEKSGGDSLELDLPVFSWLSGEWSSRLVCLNVSRVWLLNISIDIGLGNVVNEVVSAPLVGSSSGWAFERTAAGARVDSGGNSQECSTYDQLK